MKKLIIVLSCLITSAAYGKPAKEKTSLDTLRTYGDALLSGASLAVCAGRVLPVLKFNPRACALAGIFGAGMSYINQQKNSSSYVETVDRKVSASSMAALAIAFTAPSQIAYASPIKSIFGALGRTTTPFCAIYTFITVADAVNNYPATLFNLEQQFKEMTK